MAKYACEKVASLHGTITVVVTTEGKREKAPLVLDGPPTRDAVFIRRLQLRVQSSIS